MRLTRPPDRLLVPAPLSLSEPPAPADAVGPVAPLPCAVGPLSTVAPGVSTPAVSQYGQPSTSSA
jgi:hypothetical protein